MGVLEDAIREHLELKRQHGASEQELEAQADEALGPARRDVVAAEEPGPEGPEAEAPVGAERGETVAVDEPTGFPPQEEVPFDAEQAEGLPVEDEELRSEDAALAGPPVEAPPPEQDTSTDTAESAVVQFDEEEPGVAPPMPAPHGDELAEDVPGEPEPADLPAEDAPAEDAPADPESSDDVLEETPEFLEETPEHDRLWFEQKPPRDFDFD